MAPVEVAPGGEIVSLHRAADSDKWFRHLSTLPSYTVPKNPKAKQTRRLMRLARLLAGDGINDDAVDEATNTLVGHLTAALIERRGADDFEALIDDAQTLAVRVLAVGIDGTQTPFDPLTVKVTAENIEDLFLQADRRVGQGLIKNLWRRLTTRGSPESCHGPPRATATRSGSR